MGSKKKKKKEMNNWEGLMDRLEHDWAKKRKRQFPLSPKDQMEYMLEESLKNRFRKLKEQFTKGSELSVASKPLSGKNAIVRPWSFWTPEQLVSDKRFRLMSKEDMDEAVNDIEYVFNDGWSCVAAGNAIFDLSSKWQEVGDKDGGNSYEFGKAFIMVSPAREMTFPLYVGENFGIDAKICMRWFNETDINDEDYDAWNSHKICFIVFTDKNMQTHAVELEEFCAITEAAESEESDEDEESEKYTFVYYKRVNEMMFTATLSGLEDVEFIVENGELEVMEKGQKTNETKDNNDIPKPNSSSSRNTSTVSATIC